MTRPPAGVRHAAAALARDGLIVLPGPADEEAFRGLLAVLGTPLHEADIRVRADARSYVASPGAVPLHTDHPAARLIAWRCVVQDDEDGTQLLADGRAVVADLGPAAAALADVVLGLPSLAGRVAVAEQPLLGADGQMYWAPWHAPAPRTPAAEAALAAFEAALAQRDAPWLRRVRLQPGEALVVDNRRVLHGRDALAPDSRRHLRRVWLR